jgi:hypothetical protein
MLHDPKSSAGSLFVVPRAARLSGRFFSHALLLTEDGVIKQNQAQFVQILKNHSTRRNTALPDSMCEIETRSYTFLFPEWTKSHDLHLL